MMRLSGSVGGYFSAVFRRKARASRGLLNCNSTVLMLPARYTIEGTWWYFWAIDSDWLK
jgi:hypothetical protein